MASGKTPLSIFSMNTSYRAFGIVESQTIVTPRSFNQTEYDNTSVELHWYYDIHRRDDGTTYLGYESVAQSRMIQDAGVVRASLASQSCDLACFRAMIRLATTARTSSGVAILAASMPKTPITVTESLELPPVTQSQAEAQINIMDHAIEEEETTSTVKTQPLLETDGTLITRYAFISAYLLRYAYRLPGDRWDEKMKDFQSKFTDMLSLDYVDGTPTAAWANSFNTLAKDMKDKMRILIHCIIVTHLQIKTLSADRQKMFRYLFATPFAFYGMSVMIQLRKCSDSLDIPIEDFMSAITVTEIESGVNILKQVILEASAMDSWPYARAFDDSFFSKMSTLAVKKVHLVCLAIMNMKGGQSRPIPIESVRAVSAVMDKEMLYDVAAQIVAAIDMSRPDTTTSAVLKEMSKQDTFKARMSSYRSSIKNNPAVINQQHGTIDITQFQLN
nr:TPA_asm: N [Medicago trirhavirus 1]